MQLIYNKLIYIVILIQDIQKTEPGSTPVKMTFGELQELMDNANTTGTPKLRVKY